MDRSVTGRDGRLMFFDVENPPIEPPTKCQRRLLWRLARALWEAHRPDNAGFCVVAGCWHENQPDQKVGRPGRTRLAGWCEGEPRYRRCPPTDDLRIDYDRYQTIVAVQCRYPVAMVTVHAHRRASISHTCALTIAPGHGAPRSGVRVGHSAARPQLP